MPTNEQNLGESLTIVGIGASAGGLAALKSLFAAMTADTGAAFVVVVHLSPEHKSHLTELLQPHCAMPIQQVTETVRLEPNRVFIIPPNANLNTIDTHLRLSDLEEQPRHRATIDHFFRTLAQTHDGNSIGIVLTGTGADGTLGLRYIKQAGGVTIAQDPGEAEFDGMPRSAVVAGVVDFVLPIERIAEELVRLSRIEPRLRIPADGEDPTEINSRLLQKIFAQIRGRTGHDFSRYKRSTIMRRIQRRMQLQHVETFERYLEFLRENRDEINALFDDLLITVTEFFRDQQVFECLENKVIPSLFEGKTSNDRIRVWSVGCSTGEEAFSIAMLLLEEAAKHDERPQLQIFASDLHERSLTSAREGVYPLEISSSVSEQRLKRFFVKENAHYRVRREVREMVVFAPHNLLGDPPFSHMDLIVCRNVLIYLQRDVQRDVIRLFHYALEPGGRLVLGTSETVDRSELFMVEDKLGCVFRRRNVPTRDTDLPIMPVSPRMRPTGGDDEPTEERPNHLRTGESYGVLHERVVERYAPPSVLINAEHEIVHSSARAGRYMVIPGGEPTRQIFKLLREPLGVEVRSALAAARRSGESVRSRPVKVQFNGKSGRVVVDVHPAHESELEGFALVVFDELPEQTPDGDAADQGAMVKASDTTTLREMEAEVELYRQRLQATIEEYESSREEMQASNEELQSANEELRSTLEELETSKEELQSMNEELATVSQENRQRVEELSQLSHDLQNLLASTDIATLFLDRELRIVRFTPQTENLFNIRHTDRGRPLTDLTHHLDYPEIQSDARRVLDRLERVEREVYCEQGPGWFLARILPYRVDNDRIDGVVVTFIDITERKQSEQEVSKAREYAESIFETLHEPLLVLTPDLTIKSVNAAFYAQFAVEREHTIGHKIYDLGNGQWDIPALRTLLEDVLPDSNVFNDYEVQHDFENIGHRVMLLNARRLDHVQLILLGIRDVTQSTRAAVKIRESEESRGFLLTLSDAIRTLANPVEIQNTAARIIGEYLGVNRAMYAAVEGDAGEERGTLVGQYLDAHAQTLPPFPKRYDYAAFGQRAMDLRRAGEPMVVADIATDPTFDDSERAAWTAGGVRAAVTVPLVKQGRFVADFGVQSATARQWTDDEVTLVRETAERTWDAVERARAETDLRNANQFKDEFLATLAHELRNPLATVRSGLEVVKVAPEDTNLISDTCRMMERQLIHLIALVDDLLEISRISRGKLKLRREVVVLGEAIASAIDTCQPLMKEAGHELILNLLPQAVHVEGDPHRLAQLFANLVNNAVKYTPKGGRIEVSMRQEEDEVAVAIADTGIGLANDQLTHVFEMFAQAKPESSNYCGLGIGLSLVKSLVELHGGSITADSDGQGHGATFTVRLPTTTRLPKPMAESPVASPSETDTNRRVLLVDDNAAAAKLLGIVLTKLGHEVLTASNGQEAIERGREFRPDIIIMDIGMPIMDGYQAARAIRSESWGQAIPLIALTGWGQDDDKQKTHDAGFDRHLVKPVAPDALRSLLTELTAAQTPESPNQ